jgi:serine/threonine protein kinase
LTEIGVTDIWFPFDSASLPDILAPSARANFLKCQNMVLSKSLMFEKNSERTHAHFARDEPLPFQVVGRLGFGAGGYVDKVISNVSHRQYARKQLRKPRGVGKQDIKSFLIELQILKRINHHHCVELVKTPPLHHPYTSHDC